MDSRDQVLRVSTYAITLISLLADILGLGKLAYDVIVSRNFSDLPIKVLLLLLGFLFGISLGYLGIKGFKSKTIPSVVRLYAWIYLLITCASYIGIAISINQQNYTIGSFLAFGLVLITELLAIVGLHVVVEDIDLRLFSIPILTASAFHLLLVINRYILSGSKVSIHIVGDLLFFLGFTTVGSAMYGDIGFQTMIGRIKERIFFRSSSVQPQNSQTGRYSGQPRRTARLTCRRRSWQR